MKILIKASIETKMVIGRGGYYHHSACYYPFSFYKTFKELGHDVKFYGDTALKNTIDGVEYEIITDYTGYEMMFWRGLESFVFDKKFANKTAKEFKGIKCISLGTKSRYDILNYFDYMMPTEDERFVEFYKKNFPNLKVVKIPLASPCFDFVDKDNSNPYKDDNFKIVYTGIIHGRYLNYLNKMAEKGEKIYLGGTYYPRKERQAGTGVRPFKEEEIKTLLHPNINLITHNGRFNYGYQFKYLKYANVGLVFYPASTPQSLSCKITDYLVCGLPVIAEDTIPNAKRITQLNAGQIVGWNDFNAMYDAVKKEQDMKRDRNNILQKARKLFNIKDNCKLIIESVK